MFVQVRHILLALLLVAAGSTLGLIADTGSQSDYTPRLVRRASSSNPSYNSVRNNKGFVEYLDTAQAAVKRDLIVSQGIDEAWLDQYFYEAIHNFSIQDLTSFKASAELRWKRLGERQEAAARGEPVIGPRQRRRD